MASANVELVRSMYAAWERGDFDGVKWAHPEIEWVVADGPAPGSWKGLAGMAQGWHDFLSAWEEIRVEAEECRDIDADRVLVLGRVSGRGKASGLQMQATAAQVACIRDGRVTRSVMYFDRERAFADLGLSGGGGPPTSQESNLAAVAAMFDEFVRRERELTDSILDEEVAWDTRHVAMPALRRVYHGHDQVRAFWRAWLEAWERIDIVDGPHMRAHGSQVLQWWRQRHVAKGSGAAIEGDAAILWTFESGRVVRAASFRSREDAFRAAGLEP